jgi:1,4-dihydroxy-2-naphthoate octaprenyltransferase
VITLYQFLRIVEIRTKVISISGFVLGAAYVWYTYGAPDGVVLVVMGAAVLAVDMATTGFNTFFDFYHGVDRRDLNREVDKVLVHQGVPAGTALLVSLVLYGVAVGLGILLAVIATPWVVPIGALCMAVGFLYNGGPLPISRTPAGELFAGGFLGWVLVTLTIFVLAPRPFGAGDLLVGVPSLLLVASILTVNNTCDIDGDRKAGRHTLSILLGRTAGEMVVYLLGIIAFLFTVYLVWRGVFPRTVVYGLVPAAILSVPIYVGLHRRGYSHDTKGPSMGAISKVFALFSVGVIVPLIIAAAR